MKVQKLKTHYTASDARKNFFMLLEYAKVHPIEIQPRGDESMILMTKEEFDSWMETINVLSDPEEMSAIRQARKQKKHISHHEMLAQVDD